MNKKRILSIVLTVVLTLGVFGCAYYKYDREKKFDYAEKNSYAMGTIVSQKVSGDYAAKHIEKANLLISSIEKVISKNISSSVVSAVNENGEANDSDVAAILKICNEVSEKTDGAFDVTVGEIVEMWNFDGENESIPSEKELKKALKKVGYENITLDGSGIKLSTDAVIDLGAVGKGLACESVITLYKATEGLKGAIVSVGGSVGCYGSYNKAGDSWRIGIRHPRQENAFLGVLTLKEGFVSTSGDYEKFFMKDDVRYHHILDARTGYPASSDIISATVICDSGLLSDALSTACFILGSQEGARLCEKYNASAIFVSPDMEITTVGEVDFEKQ